jgi:hypothetical protein
MVLQAMVRLEPDNAIFWMPHVTGMAWRDEFEHY